AFLRLPFFAAFPTCPGLGFQRSLGLPDLLEPLFRTAQFLGKLVAQDALAVQSVLLTIDPFGRLEKGLYLGPQLRFFFLHPLVAHGFVFGGVGLHLRAVDGDMSQLDQPGVRAEAKDLHEELFEGGEVDAPKLADPRVVGMGSAGDDSKGDVLVGVPLDLAGRADPDGVGVQKQRHHHLRMVWRISPQLALVVVVDGPKVELGDQVEDEVGEVPLREPIMGGRGQQEGLMGVVGPVGLAHAPRRSRPPHPVEVFVRIPQQAPRNTASSFAASFRARCVFPAPGSPRITMGMGRFRTSDSAVRSWRRNFGYESKSARSRMEGRSFAKKKAGPFGPASLGILARYSLRGHLGTFSQSLRNLARPMSVSGCFTSCSMTA